MTIPDQLVDSLEDIERFFRKGQEWLKKQHEEGLPGGEYCQNRSALVDSVLRRLWKRAMISPDEGVRRAGISLLATGGYGREELTPFSDIDLLFLHLPGKGKELETAVQALLHPLWDWGLTVGYTVQTPREAWRKAQKDLGVLLSFLDTRWVGGDKEPLLQMEEEFARGLRGGRAREVLLQIHEEAASRHQKFGDSVFVLEPEVKDGKGGLRDYHSAYWAAKLQYGIRSAREMTEHHLLSEREWGNFSQALDFLWRVRTQLHYFHGRKEDRLSFEDQEAVAQALGYRGADSLQATESFLKEYFHQALRVHQLSLNLLEKCLNEASPESRGGRKKNLPEVAPGFFLFHGRLSLTDPSILDRNPLQVWKAFETIHRYGMGMSAPLKDILSQHLNLVNDRFRLVPDSLRSFLSLFEKPGHLHRVLEEMYETGFLQAFLPEFGGIHCHIQYDRYHLYPVDVHSLYAVLELEILERRNPSPSWPLFQELMKEVQDPGLLKLAALVHDLGKGEGSSHALRGEKIAETIGGRLGLSGERIDTLRFLIREHLTMPEIAQRRDLNDENLTLRLAQMVGSSERLKMLYLLSFADLRAVGPNAWTTWKDTLLRELFLKVLHLMEKGEGLRKEDQERIIGIQREVMDLLKGQLPAPKISEHLASIPRRHYQVHEARSIGRQILMAEKLAEQAVAADGEERPEEGGDEITVVARDEVGLFAKICGALAANHLNILSAQISTWENGVAVDQFRVQSLIEEGLLQPRRWAKVQGDLKRVLEGKVEVNRLLQEVVPPLFHPYSPARSATRVEIDTTASDFYTLVEIFTNDRPGLLYRIAQKFFEMGLNLWMARISTKVDQVVDVFYVQDLSGAKIEDAQKISTIKAELLRELERWEA